MRNRGPGHFEDGWLHVDDSSDPGFFIRFLDASRSRSLAFARRDPAAAFAHLALKPGLTVLDCGCGTGEMATLIAAQVAPGQVLGVDMSDTMVQEARRRLAAGMSGVAFQQADVQALPIGDGQFDRVLATQLLVHLPDPKHAFNELCRVTAPGGRIALADMDWDSLVVGTSNRMLGRRFTRCFSDGIRHGLVVREYGGWLRAAGFTNIRMLPQALMFDTWDFVRTWLVEPSLPQFVADGSFNDAEASALMQDLAARSESGSFFAGATFHTVVADRPV